MQGVCKIAPSHLQVVVPGDAVLRLPEHGQVRSLHASIMRYSEQLGPLSNHQSVRNGMQLPCVTAAVQHALYKQRLARMSLKAQVRIGPGLQHVGDSIVVSRAGVLRGAKGGRLWLEGRQMR